MYLVKLFEDTNLCAIHAKRVTIQQVRYLHSATRKIQYLTHSFYRRICSWHVDCGAPWAYTMTGGIQLRCPYATVSSKPRFNSNVVTLGQHCPIRKYIMKFLLKLVLHSILYVVLIVNAMGRLSIHLRKKSLVAEQPVTRKKSGIVYLDVHPLSYESIIDFVPAFWKWSILAV